MEITRPTLVIDKQKCMANIRLMATKAQEHNLGLFPHFKTHQSLAIGEWMKETGLDGISVSSVKMAEYFSGKGYRDILIAFPLNSLEIPAINAIAAKDQITLLLVNTESVKQLEEKLSQKVSFFLELDSSYHRTGLGENELASMKEILDLASQSDKLHFRGLYIHPGNSYHYTEFDKREQIHLQACELLGKVKAALEPEYPVLECRLGDTPNCAIMNSFPNVDSLGPGNYVFFDVTQAHLGSCTFSQIAVCLYAPVVALYPHRNEVVIHGGAVHLSKDHLLLADGNKNFGLVVDVNDEGWNEPLEGVYLKSLSQEHGIIHVPDSLLHHFKVGKILGVLPIHSCLTANLCKSYLDLNGQLLDHCEGFMA
jgi:D-serine deaminase-like pyridoxal phosphate-dependent protein